MWSTYGHALMAIILIKEYMLSAEFKEKEFNAQLPLQQTKINKKSVFCRSLCCINEVGWSSDVRQEKLPSERWGKEKDSKENQNLFTSSVFQPQKKDSPPDYLSALWATSFWRAFRCIIVTSDIILRLLISGAFKLLLQGHFQTEQKLKGRLHFHGDANGLVCITTRAGAAFSAASWLLGPIIQDLKLLLWCSGLKETAALLLGTQMFAEDLDTPGSKKVAKWGHERPLSPHSQAVLSVIPQMLRSQLIPPPLYAELQSISNSLHETVGAARYKGSMWCNQRRAQQGLRLWRTAWLV